jgi:hypothetical protein
MSSKAIRIQQIVEWLSVSFPVPWQIDLNIVDAINMGPDCNGYTTADPGLVGASLVWSEDKAEIQLRSVARSWMIDTLIHEWAHLRRQIGHVDHIGGCGKRGCVEIHDDEFYLEFGRISRRYEDWNE